MNKIGSAAAVQQYAQFKPAQKRDDSQERAKNTAVTPHPFMQVGQVQGYKPVAPAAKTWETKGSENQIFNDKFTAEAARANHLNGLAPGEQRGMEVKGGTVGSKLYLCA